MVDVEAGWSEVCVLKPWFRARVTRCKTEALLLLQYDISMFFSEADGCDSDDRGALRELCAGASLCFEPLSPHAFVVAS